MSQSLPPQDETVTAPALAQKRYARLMVIPPSGTARGQFDAMIALFEREFLKGGVTVISGAVTGRVVYQGGAEGRRVEGAAQLSDAERALVMAKETGADAILQIGTLEWTEPRDTRFFVTSPEGDVHEFREVSEAEFRGWQPPWRAEFASPVLVFVGRLIDVQTGEVLATFKTRSAANFNLPSDYVRTMEPDNQGWRVLSETFPYLGGWWVEEARTRTQSSLIEAVTRRIQRPGGTP